MKGYFHLICTVKYAVLSYLTNLLAPVDSSKDRIYFSNQRDEYSIGYGDVFRDANSSLVIFPSRTFEFHMQVISLQGRRQEHLRWWSAQRTRAASSVLVVFSYWLLLNYLSRSIRWQILNFKHFQTNMWGGGRADLAIRSTRMFSGPREWLQVVCVLHECLHALMQCAFDRQFLKVHITSVRMSECHWKPKRRYASSKNTREKKHIYQSSYLAKRIKLVTAV